jgi:hypothetical protein
MQRIIYERMKPCFLPFLLLSSAFSSCRLILTVEAQDYTCDYLADKCEFKNDFQCDHNSACTQNTDCFDCNYFTCHTFSYDCQECLEAKGCYWCPGDAQCYNSPDYGSNPPDYVKKAGVRDTYIIDRPRETACPSPQDFLSGEDSNGATCSDPKHFFRHVTLDLRFFIAASY